MEKKNRAVEVGGSVACDLLEEHRERLKIKDRCVPALLYKLLTKFTKTLRG